MTQSVESPLLRVVGLRTWLPVRRGALPWTVGYVRAVDGVDISVGRGRTLALVGESGSGKTTVGLSILRLVRAQAGEIWYDGVDVLKLSRNAFRPHRRALQIVFQDSLGSLDPDLIVRDIVAEGMVAFGIGATVRNRTEQVAELLRAVRLDPTLMHRYPSELSGGQRQRVGIARSLALDPKFIVCDEAVSALDRTTQGNILDLLLELQERTGVAYLFISHDLSVVRSIAHNVVVMYLGRVMEEGTADQVLGMPQHPYTRALIASIPSTDPNRRSASAPLRGEIPSAAAPPSGCRFRTRCPVAFDRCLVEEPKLDSAGPTRSRCFLSAAQ